VGRPARRPDAIPTAAGGSSGGRRPSAANQRHVHPGDVVRQSCSAASQPKYLAWLLSLTQLEHERLLGGNWKIRPAGRISSGSGVSSSTKFQRTSTSSAIGISPPPKRAEFNDPNWTVGIKLGRDGNGGYWPLDMSRQRANPGDVEKLRSTSPRRTAHGSASGLAKTRGRPVIVRRSFGPGAQ
jgi:hypothetical protein